MPPHTAEISPLTPALALSPSVQMQGKSSASFVQSLFAPAKAVPQSPHATALLREQEATRLTIRCHHCGTQHTAFDHAPATNCPGCGRTISLEDISISTPSCRTVDTRGHLRIERTGNLYSPLTVCGHGTVLGAISGELHCEGKLTLQVRGPLPVKIEAEEVFIPSGAVVECPFPIRAARIVVRGSLRAHVLVRQELHILRKGHCDGAVWARAVRVDRGGELLGSVRIGPTEAPTAGLPMARENFGTLRSALTGRFLRRRPVY